MVPKEKLLNAIREKGYRFKRQTERVELYKLQGGTNRVQLRRTALHDNKVARSVLRDVGYSEEEIDAFIAECDTNCH